MNNYLAIETPMGVLVTIPDGDDALVTWLLKPGTDVEWYVRGRCGEGEVPIDIYEAGEPVNQTEYSVRTNCIKTFTWKSESVSDDNNCTEFRFN